jgi:multiple sugar transport system permease protein
MRLAARGLRFAILAVFAAFFVVPLAWLILAPTKSDEALVTSDPLAFGSFGRIAQAWQHLDAFSDHLYRMWIGNSLLYAVSATAIALVLPIFLELNAVHLIGTALSVILPFAFYPFGVYLAYIYYATAVPRELLDAARIDGCDEWSTFRHVALPLAKPVVALVLFFSFVADWNNFFLPYTVLADSTQYPIQVGLSDLLSSTPSFNPAVGGGGQQVNIFRPELALATLLAVIPVAIVFMLSQRALVRGLVGGGVKE